MEVPVLARVDARTETLLNSHHSPRRDDLDRFTDRGFADTELLGEFELVRQDFSWTERAIGDDVGQLGGNYIRDTLARDPVPECRGPCGRTTFHDPTNLIRCTFRHALVKGGQSSIASTITVTRTSAPRAMVVSSTSNRGVWVAPGKLLPMCR